MTAQAGESMPVLLFPPVVEFLIGCAEAALGQALEHLPEWEVAQRLAYLLVKEPLA